MTASLNKKILNAIRIRFLYRRLLSSERWGRAVW